jgi:predicted neutral ceramidase superfamily lipid hydrolase
MSIKLPSTSWSKVASELLPLDPSAAGASTRLSLVLAAMAAIVLTWFAFHKSDVYRQLYVIAVTAPVVLILYAFCLLPTAWPSMLPAATIALFVAVAMAILGLLAAAISGPVSRLRLPEAV